MSQSNFNDYTEQVVVESFHSCSCCFPFFSLSSIDVDNNALLTVIANKIYISIEILLRNQFSVIYHYVNWQKDKSRYRKVVARKKKYRNFLQCIEYYQWNRWGTFQITLVYENGSTQKKNVQQKKKSCSFSWNFCVFLLLSHTYTHTHIWEIKYNYLWFSYIIYWILLSIVRLKELFFMYIHFP